MIDFEVKLLDWFDKTTLRELLDCKREDVILRYSLFGVIVLIVSTMAILGVEPSFPTIFIGTLFLVPAALAEPIFLGIVAKKKNKNKTSGNPLFFLKSSAHRHFLLKSQYSVLKDMELLAGPKKQQIARIKELESFVSRHMPKKKQFHWLSKGSILLMVLTTVFNAVFPIVFHANLAYFQNLKNTMLIILLFSAIVFVVSAINFLFMDYSNNEYRKWVEIQKRLTKIRLALELELEQKKSKKR